MPATDARIDAYIAKSAGFARPILSHLRNLVHKGCPGVTETIKWSMPFFDFEGAPLCNMAGFKEHCSPAKKAPKAALPEPAELTTALKKNKKARTAFDAFPPSHRREYIEWITEARTEATREKRIATTVEWLLEGKSRNWKYQK
jgi:hypothetical protein